MNQNLPPDAARTVDRGEAPTPPRPSPVQHVLQYFEYAYLPSHLANVSRPFCELAHDLASKLPSNPETTVALRKLLESKDAAVRAVIDKHYR